MSKTTADTEVAQAKPVVTEKFEFITSIPFFLVHLSCFLAFFLPFEWWYVALCIGLYYVRMFGITGGFHRYFSHRGYKTSRVFQFFMAFLGGTAAQKGALWWGAHHRHHHLYSDEDEDVHSPTLRGLYWAHVGWVLNSRYKATRKELVNDFYKYPELRFLNDHYWLPPALLGVGCYLLDGWGSFMWGFVISTVLLWHGTFLINSLAHVVGRRRYATTDTSKNSMILSLLTLGEGWHNNHHHYPNTANNGFYWWELDGTYYVLRMFSWVGLVWDLRLPPERILEEGRRPMAAVSITGAARAAVTQLGASATEAARNAGDAAREVINHLNPKVAEETGSGN